MTERSDIGKIIFVFGCIWVSLSLICYSIGMDRGYCMLGAMIGASKITTGLMIS